jgi:hypothetical protein
MLFISDITLQVHTTLGKVYCLKLLLGVCNTKERGDLSLYLLLAYPTDEVSHAGEQPV